MPNGTQVEDTMELREEPRFISFAAGDMVEGILTTMDRVMIAGKACVRYTVDQGEANYCSFIGTHQLNTKLRPSDLGHRVEIRCVGEDVTVKRGDNCMKVFEVRVSKLRAYPSGAHADSNDLGITDNDIPF
jgi:hypothetical protein